MIWAELYASRHRLATNGKVGSLSIHAEHRAEIVLVQAVARLLREFNENLEYGDVDSEEVSAYAIHTFSALSEVPIFDPLQLDMQEAILQIALSLEQMDKSAGQRAHSPVHAYILAAIMKPRPIKEEAKTSSPKVKDINTFAKFCSKLDNLKDKPIALIKVSLLEGSLYVPGLEERRNAVFPKTSAKEGDKYLSYIPASCTLTNICSGVFFSPCENYETPHDLPVSVSC